MSAARTSAPDSARVATGRDLAVELRGIRKRFGYRETLRGVDFELARGSSVAVFGPNGAGKSTLLKIVATRWRSAAGQGTVLGHDLDRESRAIRAKVGFVSHESLLRQELVLEENLRLAADLHGVRDLAPALALVERLGLAHRLRDLVGTYSQGLTKRANIVRSLLHSPELWLLDEPFSGLDPEGRELFVTLVEEYVASGGTVMLVTHQHELGRRLTERAITVDDGELRELATGAESAESTT